MANLSEIAVAVTRDNERMRVLLVELSNELKKKPGTHVTDEVVELIGKILDGSNAIN